MILLAAVLFGWAIATTWSTVVLYRAQRRSYNYAVQRSDEFTNQWMSDPEREDDFLIAMAKSSAYSDMATRCRPA